MTQKTLKVALLQETDRGSREANLEAIEAGLREAAAAGVGLVLLQELHNGPYFCQAQHAERFDAAEPIPGPTVLAMQKLAKELDVVLIVPIFERQAAGVYRNSASVIDADGSLLGTYRKMHIPDDPLFYEYFHGDTGAGVGASHQTGWTGLISLLLRPRPRAGAGVVPVAEAELEPAK